MGVAQNILSTVASHFGLSEQEITTKGRKSRQVAARFTICYLLKKSGYNYRQICEVAYPHLNPHNCHNAVLWGIKQIEYALQLKAWIYEDVLLIEKAITMKSARGEQRKISMEEIEKMKKLKAKGLTTYQIAKVVGRNQGSVSVYTSTMTKVKEVVPENYFNHTEQNWLKLFIG